MREYCEYKFFNFSFLFYVYNILILQKIPVENKEDILTIIKNILKSF